MKVIFKKEPVKYEFSNIQDKTVVEISNETDDIYSLVEDFSGFLQACGYGEDTIKNAMYNHIHFWLEEEDETQQEKVVSE